MVTPRAGVWIEIPQMAHLSMLPSVTPRAGVWIEMECVEKIRRDVQVTPRAGVWIEMKNCVIFMTTIKSLPVRECGLK